MNSGINVRSCFQKHTEWLNLWLKRPDLLILFFFQQNRCLGPILFSHSGKSHHFDVDVTPRYFNSSFSILLQTLPGNHGGKLIIIADISACLSI